CLRRIPPAWAPSSCTIMFIGLVIRCPSIRIRSELVQISRRPTFEKHPIGVKDIPTPYPLQQHAKPNPHILYTVVKTTGMYRCTAPDNGPVAIIDDTIAVEIPIFDITGLYSRFCSIVGRDPRQQLRMIAFSSSYEILVLIIAFPNVPVHLTGRLSHFCDIKRYGGIAI